MKAKAKMAMLIQNCQGQMLGVEKFSFVQSRRVAAANRPTTAGRRAAKMFWTVAVFIYLRNMRAMRIIRMSEGSTKAKVATHEPKMDIPSFIPAF